MTRKTTRVHHIKKEIFMEFKAFLIKYAEIGIKGNNRRFFEDALVRQMKYALKPVGDFSIRNLDVFLYMPMKSMILMRRWKA